MSIVIGFISKDEAVLMSDGLVLNNDTREVVDENCRKIQSINGNVIVGYSGIKQFGECVLENFFKLFDGDPKSITAEYAASVLCHIAKELENSLSAPLPFQMLVAGTNSSNCMVLCSFGKSTDFKITQYVATEESSFYVALNPDSLSGRDVAGEFLSDNSICVRNRMKNCIKYVSTIDDTVNDTIFELSVTK